MSLASIWQRKLIRHSWYILPGDRKQCKLELCSIWDGFTSNAQVRMKRFVAVDSAQLRPTCPKCDDIMSPLFELLEPDPKRIHAIVHSMHGNKTPVCQFMRWYRDNYQRKRIHIARTFLKAGATPVTCNDCIIRIRAALLEGNIK